ncbi:TRAM domain-containing protein, partial [Pseudoramibacter alactolyticus]
MKKGDITTVKIERTRYPGKGIGPIQDGGTAIPCAVKGAVPGQILKVRISKKRKGKAEGKLLDVLALAPDAVTPVCPMFGRCGGCTYQSTAYPSQLAMKDGWVMALLAEAGITGFEHLPALPSPEIYGYRNKMEFSFGDDCPGGPLMLGLHEKGHFYNIVSAQDCALAHPDFGAIVTAVLDYFRSRGAQAFHKRAHTGFLRYLVVRRGAATGEIMVNLVTTSQGTLDDAAF